MEERLRTEREEQEVRDRVAAAEERAATVEAAESVVDEERSSETQIAGRGRSEEQRERRRAERRARDESRRQQAAEEMAQAEQRLLEAESEDADWADRENERWRRRQQAGESHGARLLGQCLHHRVFASVWFATVPNALRMNSTQRLKPCVGIPLDKMSGHGCATW